MADSHPLSWTDRQKSALVEQIVLGRLTLLQACQQYGLSNDELKSWVRIFRRAARQALDHQLRSTLSVQGLDVEELSAAELSGDLRDLSLSDVVQTVQMGGKDAHIAVAHDGLLSRVWCKAGNIVDAESGTLRGEEALFRVLNLERGDIVADFSTITRPQTIDRPTQSLLMEAAGRRDQCSRLIRRLGSSDQPLAVVPDVAARHAPKLCEDEMEVLSLFDGQRDTHDVLMRSPLLDLATLRIAVQLFEAGVLGPTQVPPPSNDRAPLSNWSALATSHRPFTASFEPRSTHLPRWILAAGALACSSLGAVTAIAYADALGVIAEVNASQNSASLSVASLSAPAPSACPPDMLRIEGGHFTMGSTSGDPALQSARPAHGVTVATFCLDATEVTVAQYTQCEAGGHCSAAHRKADFRQAGDSAGQLQRSEALHSERCNAGRPGRQDHPINCVSFYQARDYCSSKGLRLATEAEWEFAARGPQDRRFPWGAASPNSTHINACGQECERWHHEVGLQREMYGLMFDEDDGFAGTAPVGSFPKGATETGVFDLVGNVFEWTSGGLYSYPARARNNPVGPRQSDSFVVRGGSYNSGRPQFSDPSFRFAMHADAYSHAVGLRCAASLAPSTAAPLVNAAPHPPADG